MEEEELKKFTDEELRERLKTAKSPFYRRMIERELEERKLKEKPVRPITQYIYEAVKESGGCKFENCVLRASEKKKARIRTDDARRELQILLEEGKVIKTVKRKKDSEDKEEWFWSVDIF